MSIFDWVPTIFQTLLLLVPELHKQKWQKISVIVELIFQKTQRDNKKET